MQALESQPRPDRTSFLLKEAILLVPVDEFLKLRFQLRRSFGVSEYKQLSDAADVVQKAAGKQGKKYELTHEIDASFDPRVYMARLIARKMQLTKYLAVRHKVLNDSIFWTTRRRDEYDSMGSREVEKENEKLQNRLNDLNLTNKVITAVNINLSSVI